MAAVSCEMSVCLTSSSGASDGGLDAAAKRFAFHTATQETMSDRNEAMPQ